MLRALTHKARLIACACGAAIAALSAALALCQDTTNAANQQSSSSNSGSAQLGGNPPVEVPPQSGASIAQQTTADQTLGMSFNNTHALMINNISDSSPLTNLGLQPGDQIYSFNGQALGSNPNTLMMRLVTAARNGQPASMTVYRNGQQVTINIPSSALQAVAQARAQLGNTRATAANQGNSQATALGGKQTAQTTTGNTGAAAAGNSGAASTGSALGHGAGTLNLGSSGSTASGTTTNNDASAAVSAVAGFQNGGTGTAGQRALFANQDQNQNTANSVGQSFGLTFANTPGNGLTITSVAPNSPFSGMLQPGDQLTSLDGRPLSNPENLFSQLTLAARGDQSATLSIMRNGSPQTVTLSNSLLDSLAQSRPNSPFIPKDADRFARRNSTNQNNNQQGANQQTANLNSTQSGNQSGTGSTGTAGGANGTQQEGSNLPTPVITPNGPRIVMPGQSQNQGKGQGGGGAGLPGAGTGFRPTSPTRPSGRVPSGGARPAGGIAAPGAGAAAGGAGAPAGGS
jgi:PDZ domain-containing protein